MHFKVESARYKSYFRLAYYIVLKYSLLFNEFQPLYDICIQAGFYPICNTIVENKLIELDSASQVISHNILTTKYVNEREKYIETSLQNVSIKNILKHPSNYIAYIAPTSFGKSSLIKDFIIKNNFSKIAIVVPTKSLLIQTYNEIKKLNLPYKLLVHDEMYNQESRYIGILTQERAIRLLKKGTYFDILFIDEAHNLLKYNSKDTRGLILARLIKLNKIKNPNQKTIYLSPLITDINCLKVDKEQYIFTESIKHNLKSEEFFLLENNKVEKYDKFTGQYFPIANNNDFLGYIEANSASKNFIYNYRPIKIELLAKELFNSLNEIEITHEIQTVINTLKNEVHEDFYVNEYIKKGIVYIHGKIPNLIKEYLELKFKEIPELKYIIANSVILEGINLPIDNLFITSTRYLGGKELTNLIGRVNRLNYVFKENNLYKLNPQVHFLNDEKYQGKDNVRTKIKLLRDHSFEDKIQNPLLTEYDIDKLDISDNLQKEKRRRKDALVIDYTNFIVNDDSSYSFKEQIKKYFIENSIDDFYNELDYIVARIAERVNTFKNNDYFKSLNLVEKINSIFIHELDGDVSDYEIERLKNKKARIFYNNYLEITQKQPLTQNILSTFKFFKVKANSTDPYIFIGSSYGETSNPTQKYNNFIRDVYVNLNDKSQPDLINLAIVKLKIEEDFVSFKLNKLIVFLHDFGLISESEYNLHIYGTDKLELIKLAQFGLSLNLIKKLQEDKQVSNLYLDVHRNLKAQEKFYYYLESQSELFKFEIKKYL